MKKGIIYVVAAVVLYFVYKTFFAKKKAGNTGAKTSIEENNAPTPESHGIVNAPVNNSLNNGLPVLSTVKTVKVPVVEPVIGFGSMAGNSGLVSADGNTNLATVSGFSLDKKKPK